MLFSDPGTIDGVRDLLKSAPAGRLSGTSGGQGPYVGVVYSCSRAGEASSRAHLRIVPYREQHCQRMLKGAIQAGAAADEIPRHDLSGGQLFILCDGKCHPNINQMKKAFTDGEGKTMPKHSRQIYVLTTEESERETKQRLHGIATLSTVEHIALVSKETLSMPTKKRKHCTGTNANDMIGPLDRPKPDELWKAPHAKKPQLHGTAFVDVGGKIDGDNPDADPSPKAKDLVPFAWHEAPKLIWDELAHSYNIVAWWDLCATDFTFPMEAIRNKVPYIGFCFTPDHKEALTDACVTEIFRAMSDPNDVLYESELGELVNPPAASDNYQMTPAKKPKKCGEASSSKENQSTSAAKNAKALMAKLAELDDAEDGQLE